MKNLTAECPYCGQMHTVMIPEGLEPKEEEYQAQAEALAICNCMAGKEARKRTEILTLADQHIEDLLRDNHPEAADVFQQMKEAVLEGRIRKLTISEEGGGKAEMKRSKSGISVAYEMKNKTELST